MMRRATRESGFTLIEVLIGITLLAMLGALIASGTRLGGRAWATAERQTTDGDTVPLVQALLRRTIVHAVPAFVSDDPRDRTIDFTGEPTGLSLVAPRPGTQDNGPWVRQRFYVGQQGTSRTLFVSLTPAAPRVPGGPIPLLGHISQMEFSYFGPQTPGGAPAWQNSWTNRTRLPDLIRIVIARDDPKLPIWPELIVGTRITANAGCIYKSLASDCQRTR
jgi:general secretion pathway protein J